MTQRLILPYRTFGGSIREPCFSAFPSQRPRTRSLIQNEDLLAVVSAGFVGALGALQANPIVEGFKPRRFLPRVNCRERVMSGTYMTSFIDGTIN